MQPSGANFFGWDIDLSNDATKLVVLHNFSNCSNTYLNTSSVCNNGYNKAQNAIHLFTFADSNFLTPTYVGAITSENDDSNTCQDSTQNCNTGNSGFLYNNSKILPETFDWGHVISGGYNYGITASNTYWTEKLHHVSIALCGDGTRVAVSCHGSDDSRRHIIGLYRIGHIW